MWDWTALCASRIWFSASCTAFNSAFSASLSVFTALSYAACAAFLTGAAFCKESMALLCAA
jgi:hypothetical protein